MEILAFGFLYFGCVNAHRQNWVGAWACVGGLVACNVMAISRLHGV